MTTSLLGLPIELLENIFLFADDKSLLEMRKVCKATKELAEATSLNRSEPPEIDSLELLKKINCKIEFEFSFGVDRLRSKLFLVSAMNYLKVPAIGYHSKEITTTMTSADTSSFFDRFAPLMRNVKIGAVQFCPPTPETFSLISTFLDGKIVHGITFVLNESDEAREFLLHLIGKLRSTAIRLMFAATLDVPFLMRLAGIVDALIIKAPIIDNEFTFLNMPNLAHEILQSRCAYLDLSNAFNEISLREARILATVLEGIPGKYISFAASTSEKREIIEDSGSHMIRVIKDKNSVDRHRVEIRIM